MKKSILISIAFVMCASLTFASVKTDIEKANKAGKVVFLVVTEPGNPGMSKALDIAKGAQTKYTKSTVIQMNRADKTNQDLVIKYQLTGTSLPIILVIASNGAVASGQSLSNATSQSITEMIPSAKKADVLKAMQEGKSVFLVVSKKSHQKKEVISKCKDACADLKENVKIIEVDFDDASEKKFLAELKLTEIGNEPQTYVINSGGQISGSFTGVTEAKNLVATATKKAGGCCAPGSGKTCAPKK